MSKEFWDSVADVYETNDMTNCEEDYEMSIVNSLAVKVKPNILMCYGCADGSRDPIKILSEINTPDLLILGDISDKMLSIAEKRVRDIVKNVLIINYPLENLTIRYPLRKSPYIVFGLYSAKYINEALSLYNENSAIIGKIFNLSAIFYSKERGIYRSGDDVTFDISDSDGIISSSDVISWYGDKNFLAYSINTETGFVSHYYNDSIFTEMLMDIFPNFDIDIEGNGKRHFVCTIKPSEKDSDILITVINNVIGNINWNDQIKAIEKLKVFFLN